MKDEFMDFTFILGCDVSKKWLDFNLVYSIDHSSHFRKRISNDAQSIRALAIELLQNFAPQGFDLDQVVLVLEHTGVYQHELVDTWLRLGSRLSIVDARKISQFIPRSVSADKTDELDAARIAQYGSRFVDQLELWQAPAEVLATLKALQSLQSRLITVRQQLEHPLNEVESIDSLASMADEINKLQADALSAIHMAIARTEARIDQLIREDKGLKRLFKLLTSVTGIGPVIATAILVETLAFTRFTPEQARSFCNFEGLVPSKHHSGKSIRRKKKGPSRRGRSLKTLLTMGAKAAMRTDPEIKTYTDRKIAEGKHYFVVINNVRNKLVSRAFAVVKKNTMYQKNMNVCLVNT